MKTKVPLFMQKADFLMTQLIYSYYSADHKFPSIVSKNIMFECVENFIHKYSHRAGALKLWEQNLHYFVHLYSVSYNCDVIQDFHDFQYKCIYTRVVPINRGLY